MSTRVQSVALNGLRETHERLTNSMLDQPLDRQMRLFLVTRVELVPEVLGSEDSGSDVSVPTGAGAVRLWAVNQFDQWRAVEQLLRRVAAAGQTKALTKDDVGRIFCVKRQPYNHLFRAQVLYILNAFVDDDSVQRCEQHVRVSYIDLGQEETIPVSNLISDEANVLTVDGNNGFPALARSYILSGALVMSEQCELLILRILNRYLYRVLHGFSFYDESDVRPIPKPQVVLYDPDTGRALTDLLINNAVALESPAAASPVFSLSSSPYSRSGIRMNGCGDPNSSLLNNSMTRLSLNATPINVDQTDCARPVKVVNDAPVVKLQKAPPKEVIAPVVKPVEPPKPVVTSAPVAQQPVTVSAPIAQKPVEPPQVKKVPEPTPVVVTKTPAPLEFAEIKEVTVGQTEELYLTCMSSKDTTFGQLTRIDNNDLAKMHDEVQAWVAAASGGGVKVADDLPGKYVLAPWLGEFYRAQVLSSTASGLSLLFIDWGNVEDKVDPAKCYPLPAKLATTAPFGIRIEVVSSNGFDDENMARLDALVSDEEMAKARTVLVKITSKLEPNYYVGTIVAGHNVNKKFFKAVKPSASPKKDKESKTAVAVVEEKKEAAKTTVVSTKPAIAINSKGPVANGLSNGVAPKTNGAVTAVAIAPKSTVVDDADEDW